MKTVPRRIAFLLLAVMITFGTVFMDYETAYATGASGVEETLYYTFWDLIYTIGLTCGFEIDFNDSAGSDVTGEKFYYDYWNVMYDQMMEAGYSGDVINQVKDEYFSLPDTIDPYSRAFTPSDALIEAAKLANEWCMDPELAIPEGCQFPLTISMVDALVSSYVTRTPGFSTGSLPASSEALGMIGGADGFYNYFSSCPYYTLCVTNAGAWVLTGYKDLDFDGTTGAAVQYMYSATWYRVMVQSPADWLYTGDVVIATNIPDLMTKDNIVVFPTDVSAVTVLDNAVTKPDEIVECPSIADQFRIVENPEEDPEENKNVIPALIPISPTVSPGVEVDPMNPTVPVPDPDPAPDPALDPSTDSDSVPDDVVSQLQASGDITTLFPFCIPFDLARLIKGMQAKKAPPVFHFEYKFKKINYTFKVDVDLSDYEKYISIFRSGMMISYVIGLMFLTVRVAALFI